MAQARGLITRWSRPAAGLAVVALVAPEGPYRWAALALAGATLVVAATRVPRQAWAANRALLVSLACAVGAIWVTEFFSLDERVTMWIVGLTGALLVGSILHGAVRILRQKDKLPDSSR